MENPQPPRCVICETTQQLLRCAKCKTVYYCSTTHQHMDWQAHKQNCRLLAKQKSNTKYQQLQQSIAASTLNNAMPPPDAVSGQYTNGFNAFMASTAMDAGILNTVPPMGTNENEILSSKAESVSQNSNSVYHGNVATNSNAMEQLLFAGGGVGYAGAPALPQQSMSEEPQQPSCRPSLQAPQYQLPQAPLLPHFINHNNGQSQSERSASYQIGRGDENAVMGNANERRYGELCRNIINDMNQYGLSVVDDFLGNDKGLQILNEVHRMYAAGVFRDGQLVNNLNKEKERRTIRGDKITWVKGVEPHCVSVGYLINQIDAVICRANMMKNNGKIGNYNIKERTKAMVACYPGSGSHYVMHVDNPNKDGRVITAIYYLNVNWDTIRSGGVLRIFPEHGNSVADIEPKFDRLIFFWSDKRNPHEVQPAHRTRYAITVWYFDADEREAALNRCKYKNNSLTSANANSTTKANTPTTNSNKNPSEICT